MIMLIKRCIGGKLTRKQASIMLDVTTRTVTNLKNRFKAFGKDGFINKNTNKIPANKINKKSENKIINLYKNKYKDFNFSHFYDYIISNNDINFIVSLSTVKNILNRNNIYSPCTYKQKNKTNHPLRQRKQSFGELIQMDASELDWLNIGKIFHLHLAVDDVTNTIIAGYFGTQETTAGYIKCLYQTLTKYGVPKCFYTDNRTSFNIKRNNKNINANVQFKRIINSFGIEIKTTSIPQAKGRVERYNGVLQDRLANELKFNNIKTIKEANKYLINIYIPKHNKRFAFDINKFNNIFNEFTGDINKTLTVEVKRTVLNGNCISLGNNAWVPVNKNNKRVLLTPGKKVTIIKTFDNKGYLRIDNKVYEIRRLKTPPKEWKKPLISSNHPYYQTYGQKIKEQDYKKYGKIYSKLKIA